MCTKTDWNILATQSQLSDFICRDIFKFMATGFLSNDHLLNFSVNQSHYWCSLRCKKQLSPAGNYMFKVNNRNTRTRYEICLKLIVKTPEWRHWRRGGVFIGNFEHISALFLVFLLLTLNMQLPAVKALRETFRTQSKLKHFYGCRQYISFSSILWYNQFTSHAWISISA